MCTSNVLYRIMDTFTKRIIDTFIVCRVKYKTSNLIINSFASIKNLFIILLKKKKKFIFIGLNVV